jgi:hypothetical protein
MVVLETPMSAAPDDADAAEQACEHLQASAAVDGVAVPGTMHVATAVPPRVDEVGDGISTSPVTDVVRKARNACAVRELNEYVATAVRFRLPPPLICSRGLLPPRRHYMTCVVCDVSHVPQRMHQKPYGAKLWEQQERATVGVCQRVPDRQVPAWVGAPGAHDHSGGCCVRAGNVKGRVRIQVVISSKVAARCTWWATP